MWRFLWLVALSSCVESSTRVCANGETCPSSRLCDDIHGGCIDQDQLDACIGIDEDQACTAASLTGEAWCSSGVCLANVCGDGIRSDAEACDGMDFGTIARCPQLRYYDDLALGCTASCEIDESVCTGECGDSVVNGDEECDGALPVRTCVDFGYGAGAIECASTCGPDLTACIPFGWRSIPMPQPVLHVHGTSPTNVWVVGDAGMVRRFDGTQWIDIDVSACTTSPLVYVQALSSTEAFLLDRTEEGENAIIRVTGAGCTKSVIPGPAVSPSKSLVHSLWAGSIDDAYVVYDDPTVGTWHFDGTSWTKADSTRARFVWGTGPDNVYTATSTAPQTGAELQHFDGTTWSSIPVPGMISVKGLWGSAPDDIFVAGQGTVTIGNVTYAGAPLIVHWDGMSWTPTLEAPAVLDASQPFQGTRIGSAGTGHAYVVGKNGLRTLLLGWDGIGWTHLDAPAGNSGGVPYAAPNGTVYYAPLGVSQLLVMDEATRVDTGSLTDARSVYALGGEALIATKLDVFGKPQIFAWDGVNWRAEQVVNDLHVLADGTTFVVSDAGVGRRALDGTYAFPSMVTGYHLGGTSSSDLWVISSGLGAATVTHLDYDSGVSQDYAVGVADATEILALTPNLAFVFTYGKSISRFDGTMWIPATGAVANIAGSHAASATDAYAWSSTAIQHFDGTSWTLLSPPPPLTTIDHVWGARNELFVGGDLGLFYYDGSRWTPVDTGFVSGVTGVAGRGASIVFATFEGVRRIYRTRDW